MKTVGELLEWCEGAEREFGDPSIPVGLMFVRYGEASDLGIDQRIDQILGDPDRLIVAEFAREELLLDLLGTAVPLKLSSDGMQIENDQLMAFGVEKITRGVWALTPSLNLQGILHAFVVVYDVPTPAPWERLIILT
jgi:hypothetical protein